MAKIKSGSTVGGEPIGTEKEIGEQLIETNLYLGRPRGSEICYITLVEGQPETGDLTRDGRARTQGMIVGARGLGSDYPSSGLFMVNAVKGGFAGNGEGASMMALHNLHDFSSLVKLDHGGKRYIAIRINPDDIPHRNYDAGVYFTGQVSRREQVMLLFKEDVSNVTEFSGGDAIDARISGAGLVVDGTISESSDIRFKEDLLVIPNALDKIDQLTGYTFKRKNRKERSAGLVAQDVEKVLPEAVRETAHGKSLNYGNLAGLLVEGIKELKNEIDDLRKDLKDDS